MLGKMKTRRPYESQGDPQDSKSPQQPSDHVYGLAGWIDPHQWRMNQSHLRPRLCWGRVPCLYLLYRPTGILSIGEIVRPPHFSDALAECQCVLVRTYLIFLRLLFSGARYYSACSEFAGTRNYSGCTPGLPLVAGVLVGVAMPLRIASTSINALLIEPWSNYRRYSQRWIRLINILIFFFVNDDQSHLT